MELCKERVSRTGRDQLRAKNKKINNKGSVFPRTKSGKNETGRKREKQMKNKADEEIRTLDPLRQGDALPLSYIRREGMKRRPSHNEPQSAL